MSEVISEHYKRHGDKGLIGKERRIRDLIRGMQNDKSRDVREMLANIKLKDEEEEEVKEEVKNEEEE